MPLLFWFYEHSLNMYRAHSEYASHCRFYSRLQHMFPVQSAGIEAQIPYSRDAQGKVLFGSRNTSTVKHINGCYQQLYGYEQILKIVACDFSAGSEMSVFA